MNVEKVKSFIDQLHFPESGAYASVPGGNPTLYGTCYAWLTQYYLDADFRPPASEINFVKQCQSPDTGLFVGPEIQSHSFEGKKHDREHVLLHLTCAVLPALLQFDETPLYSITEAKKFCDLNYLKKWLDARDLRDAWLEGNNLLFIGQLLVYLRDVENYAPASTALDVWFDWHDHHVDPNTGLWGSNGFCSDFVAMCGGYHQLLVYYHENHQLPYSENLIDTVLALQHADGGFSPGGGGGACEDVDAVDILVNLYKVTNYKRTHIRIALRRNLKHIFNLQNSDGGFPYKRNAPQSHMGINDTVAPPNTSTMFATWFRVHTIALISEIITDEEFTSNCTLNFSRTLSMGWHRSWKTTDHQIKPVDRLQEVIVEKEMELKKNVGTAYLRLKNKARRLLKLIRI